MKKQLILVGGGDSYSDREDFLNALRTKEIRHAGGASAVRWNDTLAQKLGDQFEVYAPSMPNTDNATYDEWVIWFERYLAFLEEKPVLIGWSLGGMFLIKYMLEHQTSFPVLFLLAPPCGEYSDGKGNDCGSFQFDTNQLTELANKVANIQLFHSKDDFVVPYEHAEKYKMLLPTAQLHTFEDKNHFLIEEFPELIQLIQKL